MAKKHRLDAITRRKEAMKASVGPDLVEDLASEGVASEVLGGDAGPARVEELVSDELSLSGIADQLEEMGALLPSNKAERVEKIVSDLRSVDAMESEEESEEEEVVAPESESEEAEA